LSELSRAVGIEKKFIDMTRDDVICYLDRCRKPENEDPLHKWIGSYNVKLVTLSRFFKWLYYPNIEDPKRRRELSTLERRPDCIMGIKQLKRKEISCYKPSDLWTQEDDLLFLARVCAQTDFEVQVTKQIISHYLLAYTCRRMTFLTMFHTNMRI
jgi:hypothetical protein